MHACAFMTLRPSWIPRDHGSQQKTKAKVSINRLHIPTEQPQMSFFSSDAHAASGGWQGSSNETLPLQMSSAGSMLRSCSNDIGSEGLQPQLVRCAPFLSIAPYFRILYLLYLKVQTTIIWYPDVGTSIIYLSEGKDKYHILIRR
jgi:hypothetical protein